MARITCVAPALIAVPLVWLVGCGGSDSAESESAVVGSAHPSPFLVVTEPAADLGTVPYGQQKEHRFLLRNVGGADLVITELTTSCACAGARVEHSTVPPGESTGLVVATRPDAEGRRTATVEIHSNTAEGGSPRVSITWNTYRELEMLSQGIHFGTLRPGATAASHFDLFRFQPDSETGALPELLFESTGPEVQCGAPAMLDGRIRVPVTLTAGTTPGEFGRRITIQGTGENAGEPLGVRVDWAVVEPVRAIPPRLSFGQSAPATAIERRVRILSSIGDLTIDRAEVSRGDWLADIAVTTTESTEAALVLRATAPAATGVHSGSVTVYYSAPEPGELVIPVSIICRAEEAAP